MKTIHAAFLLFASSTILSLQAATPEELRALFDCTGKSVSKAQVESENLKMLARGAISDDAATAKRSIEKLRERGAAGLQALLDEHAELLNAPQVINILGKPVASAAYARLKSALDAVGQQRDCYASKLFWFTDLEQAKSAAQSSGKPILSLRLLGKLDEELSCANSRYFRTTLYANAEVSQYLRDHFVLHWKSVRPVPRITVDFGDGRKIERTITGNSIHYVLDGEGRIVDALPGLYAPKTFLANLRLAESVEKKCAGLSEENRLAVVREFQKARLAELNRDFTSDLQKIGNNISPTEKFVVVTPTALQAGRKAAAKGEIELPILKAAFPSGHAGETAQSIDDETWTKIAALHSDESRLDESSRALIRAKNPNAFDAGRITISKSIGENPLLRAIRNLEGSIAQDTVRNEYVFHAKILDWLAKGTAPSALDEFNSKVYAELFLTPDSDPWLGLVPRDAISALDNNGIVQTAKR
jgi:hypothetical protein